MKYWYILITKKWYLGVWIISLQYYKIWGIWGHQVSNIRWGSLLFFRILLSNRSKSWSWSWRCSCLVLSWSLYFGVGCRWWRPLRKGVWKTGRSGGGVAAEIGQQWQLLGPPWRPSGKGKSAQQEWREG